MPSGKEPDLPKDPKKTQTARHNGAQRKADAESAIKKYGGGNLPKQDSQPNIFVPETSDGASRLPKPLFSVVEETPEMTSMFASPDSAFESRPVDPDDTKWKTPAITEMSIDGNKRRAENDGPRRKSQSNDRAHGRSKSYSTPKGPRKRLHWAKIEDFLAPSKIDESSSDTEYRIQNTGRRPSSRRASSPRKPMSSTRDKHFSASSSEDEPCARSKPKFDGTGSFETAKIPSITSRAVDIIRTAYLSTLLT